MRDGNILIFSFSTRYRLASAFMRLQEFYESPYSRIRNHRFTHEEYMDAYADENDGIMSYFDDWQGFNIPGEAVDAFMEKFDEASLWFKELRLIREIKRATQRLGMYYVIGITQGDKRTLLHELAHAFFYLDVNYRDRMMNAYYRWEQKSRDAAKIHKLICEDKYDKSVAMDEIQAYLATSSRTYLRDSLGYAGQIPGVFKKIFQEKFKGTPDTGSE